jgi:hypothetical protein
LQILAFNETLISGMSTFHNVQLGRQDEKGLFEDFIGAYPCINSSTPHFLQTCATYNAQGLMGMYGYG